MRVLVTGGAGFIGSHIVEHFVEKGHNITVLDALNYAGGEHNLASVKDRVRVCPVDLAKDPLDTFVWSADPQWVIHMAAETHVDRSIENPELFMQTNAVGTTRLLQALHSIGRNIEKIIIYSTDEVFGSTPDGEQFDEYAPYNPSNAYSASKVAVEAIANSFWITHGMPLIVVRPCNTYGPRQHHEKVIPKFVRQALLGEPITLYNDGQGARDWLHVKDHARAIETLCQQGGVGESYNLAAGDEHTDEDIMKRVIDILRSEGCVVNSKNFKYVPGRPGHDRRYWMSNAKLLALGWKPEVPFDPGFYETVLWNVQNQDWWEQQEEIYASAT